MFVFLLLLHFFVLFCLKRYFNLSFSFYTFFFVAIDFYFASLTKIIIRLQNNIITTNKKRKINFFFVVVDSQVNLIILARVWATYAPIRLMIDSKEFSKNEKKKLCVNLSHSDFYPPISFYLFKWK